MSGDTIELIAVGVTAGIALCGGNAFLVKLVVQSAISKALLDGRYVTREELCEHVEQCPALALIKNK